METNKGQRDKLKRKGVRGRQENKREKKREEREKYEGKGRGKKREKKGRNKGGGKVTEETDKMDNEGEQR